MASCSLAFALISGTGPGHRHCTVDASVLHNDNIRGLRLLVVLSLSCTEACR